ncbi:hypothetical protein GQ54DRAFT_182005 [Martensiomyces pterosporus]|nr:hypothetical protein GQ54DRAFT_182005 [Martensiomyces pterosporus]
MQNSNPRFISTCYPYIIAFLNTLTMAFLDDLPLDILLAVVRWLYKKPLYKSGFCRLLPVASVSTRLRQSLLPLLYSDLVFEFLSDRNYSTRHNASLARSAGCSKYVQRVSLFVEEYTNPDDIVRAVRDDMDAGSETKWPNLRSYAYTHGYDFDVDNFNSCWNIIKQVDKELPKLRQAAPVTCDVSSGIPLLAYNPPSVSLLSQLTSLFLYYNNQGVDANYWPPIFAPTLVDLALYGVNPESIWNIFYDGQEGQTVVFARLKRLIIGFENPLHWGQSGGLPPHLQGATNSALAKRSVWTAGAASGELGCRVPLFPVLHTLWCTNMAYNFCDFITRTQGHDSLVSLVVGNKLVYFDFDVNMFKNLESVKFFTPIQDTDEERTGSVDLYKSAFTSLLRTKTNIQSMAFTSTARDTLFQVPPDIGCVNLRSLILGVDVDFKSMLLLLSSLKHLVKLELGVNYAFIYDGNDEQEDAAEYIDELQPLQADYPPVSSTLRRFTCRLHDPRVRRCYTAAYAFELALHLPALGRMDLSVRQQSDVGFYEALLCKFLQELSGSPYMNNGLLNAKVAPCS